MTGRRRPWRFVPVVLVAAGLLLALGVGTPARAAGTGSIHGSVFADDLGDGTRGPEDQPLGSCSAELDPSADGQSAAQTIQRDETADGTFTFTSVAPGAHSVVVGCLYGTQDRPPGGITEQHATTPNPLHVTVSADTTTEVSFGFFVPPFVFGQVFSDDNADGVKQASEPGIDGCTVTVDGASPVTTGTVLPYVFHPTDHGAFQEDPGPGRHHLAATCPGRTRLTVAPADFVAHSHAFIGAAPQTGPSSAGDPAPLYFGFAPAAATTARPTTTSSTASSTTTTSASTTSTVSDTTTTTRARPISSTTRGGHPLADALGITALVAALGAVGFAYLRRRGEPR